MSTPKAWERAGFEPQVACEWQAAGFSATDAKHWVACKVTSAIAARGWRDMGAPIDMVWRAMDLALSPDAISAWSQSQSVQPLVAAQLLIAAGGNGRQAQVYLSQVTGHPAAAQAEMLEYARLSELSPGMVAKLQERGLTRQDFWCLGKARVPETAVEQLLDSGLKAGDILQAAKAGYLPEEMCDLLPALADFSSAVGGERLSLYAVIDAKIPSADLRAVDPATFREEERQVQAITGMRPNPNPPPGRVMPTIVDEYLRQGVVAGFAAWFMRGVGPIAAGAFRRARIDPATADAWLTSGFTTGETLDHLRAGTDLAVAVARRMPLSWATYFRRSRMGKGWFALRRRADFNRFYQAAQALAVPHWVWVNMFSPRDEEWRFLDGGISFIQRYGFFGPNGSWVVGSRALQLMCSRLGLEPPRRLKGAERLEPDQLESLLQEQRLREWQKLEDKPLPTDVDF